MRGGLRRLAIRVGGPVVAVCAAAGFGGGAAATSICIDPGHGGYDPGAVGNGLYEDQLNLTAALAFRDWLNLDSSDGGGGGSWAVYMTRDTDVYVSLSARSDYANSLGVDYFMCIHTNAGGGDGTETYSRYSGTNSDNLAHRVQEEVVSHLGTTDRGVKYASYSVLSNTSMPAELHEIAFIDTWAGNAQLLADPANLDEVGLAHLHAIQRHVGLSAYTPYDCVPTTEVCNGADDDCDGDVDEGQDTPGCTSYFLDGDGDGFGVSGDAQCWCQPHGLYSAAFDGDCDDAAVEVNPGAIELCDDLDNDCDGAVDDGDPVEMGATLPEFAATLVDGSYPRSLAAGQGARVWAEFVNEGADVWPARSTGIRAEAAEDGWASDLYAPDHWPAWDVAGVLDRDVEPGDTGVFSFWILAPDDPGAVIVETFRLVGPQGQRMNCPNPTANLEVAVTLENSDTTWTTPSASVDHPPEGQGGCRQAPGTAANPVWLLLLPVVLVRRRSWLLVAVAVTVITTCPARAYDRNAAVSYAWTWCGGARNPAYCDYSGVGGDCANFVSQCLIAGGIYLGGWGCGGTQPSAGYLSDNLRTLGWDSTYGCFVAPPANTRPGDVIIFYGDCENYVPGSGSNCNMGHAVFVLTDDWSSGAWIGAASHTGDYCNAPYWYWDYMGCVEWLHYPDDCVPVAEICDGIDNDCDGLVDEDQNALGCTEFFHDGDNDGWGTDDSQCWCAPVGAYDAGQPGDCDDGDPSVNPDAAELCDGLDNNCNDLVDEGRPTVMGEKPPDFAALLHDVSHPRTLVPGERAVVWVEFENVGHETWPRNEIWLGALGADETSDLYEAESWLAWDVAASLDEDVLPGEMGYFLFAIEAPPTAGLEISEVFGLVDPDGEEIACPGPEVVVEVKVGDEDGVGGDAGDPEASTTEGCSCSTTPAQPARGALVGLAVGIAWALARRTRARR